jgi:hypothetical protein
MYDSGSERERILELVDGEGVEFDGADLLRLRGPIVYLIRRDNQMLYVGMSANGLARPFSRMHRIAPGLTEADTLQVWPVANIENAVELEARLIRHLMPLWNIVGRGEAITARLGIRPKSLGNIPMNVRREIPSAHLLVPPNSRPRPALRTDRPISRQQRDELRKQRRSRKKTVGIPI